MGCRMMKQDHMVDPGSCRAKSVQIGVRMGPTR
jgi:hypothetical protein